MAITDTRTQRWIFKERRFPEPQDVFATWDAGFSFDDGHYWDEMLKQFEWTERTFPEVQDNPQYVKEEGE